MLNRFFFIFNQYKYNKVEFQSRCPIIKCQYERFFFKSFMKEPSLLWR